MTRGVHDIGGLPAGDVDRTEHDAVLWEKHVDAIMSLLVAEKKIMRVDELRRGIESLADDAYNSMTYYERWIASITKILVEKGVLDQAEVDARVAEIQAREAAP